MSDTMLVWTCNECGRDDISEDYADCPVCGGENPSVYSIEYRHFAPGDIGGINVRAGGLLIKFTSSAAKSNGVASDCPLCGATINDWTSGRESHDRPNHVQHVRFHAGLEA